MIDKAKPLLIVSGFLGAGKTSFLRRILAALDRTKYYTDVVLNDFANAEIDTATLQGSSSMLRIGPRLDTRALDRLVAREFGKHAPPETTESLKTPIKR